MVWNHFVNLILWLAERLRNVVYYMAGSGYLTDQDGQKDETTSNSDVDSEEEKENGSESGWVDDSDHSPARSDPRMRGGARKNTRDRRPVSFKSNPQASAVNVRTRNDDIVQTYNTEEICMLKNPYCVVIVNVNFQGLAQPRNGGGADLKNIRNLLEEKSRFKAVYVYLECTRRKTLKIIDEIAHSDQMKHHDGFVCFISSHGTRRGILSVDKEVFSVDELTARLNGKRCANLREKPKLFFISACRGDNADEGVPVGSIVPDAGDEVMAVPKLPTEADFLISYSTTKDSTSFRRFSMDANFPDMGSWFISVLTDVFSQYMMKEDLMHMLTRVNNRVAKMATGGDDHVDGLKQMPVQMHMLRKRVLFGNHGNGDSQ